MNTVSLRFCNQHIVIPDASTPAPEEDDHPHEENNEQKKEKPKCGSCYGAGSEGQCCSTCAEVRELYKKKSWVFVPTKVQQVVSVFSSFQTKCSVLMKEL